MDEPLSNLDAQLRQQMRGEIRALQRRLDMTMVYVTHDQTEAMTMADQVVLMRSGHIEQCGTPAELYERPATMFAAGFIGAPAMNLFPAALAGGAEGVTLGVRPEHLRVSEAGSGLPAHVEAVEYLGAESMLVCASGASRIVVRQPGRATAVAGNAIGLHWHQQDLHHFDTASGRRLDAAVPFAPPHSTPQGALR